MNAPTPQEHQDDLCRRWLAKMMTAVRDRPSMKQQRKIMNAGREQICNQARLLAQQDTTNLSDSQQAARTERITILRRLCQSQYILRTREMTSKGIPPERWKREPDKPRRPGRNPDIIAHANRVAAASATRDENRIAAAVTELLVAASRKPESKKKGDPETPAG